LVIYGQEQTNDEFMWLVVVVVGVDWREQTDDKPTWLVVVVVVVGVETGETRNEPTTSLRGSLWLLWVWTGENRWTTSHVG
jgi:hypothetical protein